MNTDPSANALPATLVFFYPWTEAVATNARCCCCTATMTNRLSAWWTADERQPECRFSHVELLVGGLSYGIRWGERVHADERSFSNEEAYAFATLYVEPAEHRRLVAWLNGAVLDGWTFNHVGNALNFLMPEPLLFALWGPYGGGERSAFCAEFIAMALQRIGVLSDDLHPGVVSPNRLWAEVKARQGSGALNLRRLVPSPHPHARFAKIETV